MFKMKHNSTNDLHGKLINRFKENTKTVDWTRVNLVDRENNFGHSIPMWWWFESTQWLVEL